MKKQIRQNWDQIRYLGPKFMLRHLQRFTGEKSARVSIPNFGHLHIRLAESDVEVVMQTIAHRQYEMQKPLRERVYARYLDIIRSGKTPAIVDAGANIGVSAMWFAKEYPLAKIVAVEPENGNFALLAKNADLNENIIPVKAAIGSTEGFASVLPKPGASWGAETSRSANGLPILTMTKAFDLISDAAPFLAKIDIEGFESDLFSSSTDWLNNLDVLLIEPHDWLFPRKGTSRPFQKVMAEHDFEIHIIGENLVYVRAGV